MGTIRRTGLLAIAAVALLGAVPAVADPSGTWLTQSGDTKVRIAPCAAAFCGTIVWQKTPTNDVNNPDPAKRSRPLVGVQLMSGLTGTGADRYAGKLYNPEDGKTYTGKITMQGPATMKLSGCVLGGLVCKAQTWTKSD